jgi:hypothetical protein
MSSSGHPGLAHEKSTKDKVFSTANILIQERFVLVSAKPIFLIFTTHFTILSMAPEFELQNDYQQIKTAVVIAIILGLVTSVFFVMIEKESYSYAYLVPDSIIHNPDDNTVLYAYGITSSENQKMDYTLDTYVGDELVNTKQFSLNNGETFEERAKTDLPADAKYPLKITLALNGSKSESVHFWIDNQTF